MFICLEFIFLKIFLSGKEFEVTFSEPSVLVHFLYDPKFVDSLKFILKVLWV